MPSVSGEERLQNLPHIIYSERYYLSWGFTCQMIIITTHLGNTLLPKRHYHLFTLRWFLRARLPCTVLQLNWIFLVFYVNCRQVRLYFVCGWESGLHHRLFEVVFKICFVIYFYIVLLVVCLFFIETPIGFIYVFFRGFYKEFFIVLFYFWYITELPPQ